MLDQHTSDKWNPVFWKEMHLMHQNHLLLGMPLIVIALDMIFAVALRYMQNHEGEFGDGGYTGLLVFFCVLMGFVNLVWLGIQSCRVTAQERMVEGLDPMLGTRLTPCQVLLGKYAAMMVCILSVHVLALPFLFYVGIYAGHNQLDDLICWLSMICGMTACGAMGVLGATLKNPQNTSKNFRMSLLGILLMAPGVFFYLERCMEFSMLGEPRAMYQNTMGNSMACILVCLNLLILVFCLTWGILRNRQQERALPWRVCMLLSWLMLPLLIGYVYEGKLWTKVWSSLPSWGFFAAAVVAVLCCFERLLPSRRTLREGTPNPVLKTLLLPLRSGVGPGLIAAWLLYLCGWVLLSWGARRHVDCSGVVTDNFMDPAFLSVSSYLLLYVPLVVLLEKWLGVKREHGMMVVVGANFFLPIFSSIVDIPLLACPCASYPMMLDDTGIGQTNWVVVWIVAGLGALLGAMVIGAFCRKYYGKTSLTKEPPKS